MKKNDFFEIIYKNGLTSQARMIRTKNHLTAVGILSKNKTGNSDPNLNEELNWLQIAKIIFTIYAGPGENKDLREFCQRRIDNSKDEIIYTAIFEALENSEIVKALYFNEHFIIVATDNESRLYGHLDINYSSQDNAPKEFAEHIKTNSRFVSGSDFVTLKKFINTARSQAYN